MIPAKKNPFIDRLFYWYLRRTLRRHFFAVDADGLENLRNLDLTRPTIAVSNHTNWWDGLLVFLLTRVNPNKSFYCMMEEKQLKHYRFFTWIGAFSVDLSRKVAAAAGLRYAMRLLEDPCSLVWIFPSGAMISARQPTEIRPGSIFLARRHPRCQVLPVAFLYEFWREDRPQILIKVGTPIPGHEVDEDRVRDAIQRLVTDLELISKTQRAPGFERLIRPKMSLNRRWDWWKLILTGRWQQARKLSLEN